MIAHLHLKLNEYFHFRDAETINFDNHERGKQDGFLYHEEHLPYKTTIRKMRPPVSNEEKVA